MLINGTDYLVLTLDFETFYGTGYSLTNPKYNTFKYITDPQFKIHGVGVQIDDDTENAIYFRHEQLYDAKVWLNGLRKRFNKPIALNCHNTAFDGLILWHCFDKWRPDYYLDTLSMSRGMFVGFPANLKDLAIRLWPEDETRRKGDELITTFNKRELTDAEQDVLGGYCMQDVNLTYLAFIEMEQYFPDDEIEAINKTLRFNCWPYFECDQALLNEEINYQLSQEAEILASAADQYAATDATIDTFKKQLSSNPQFSALLERLGVRVPLKKNPKNEDIPALGQKDWDYQKLVASHPEHATLWAARKNAKSNIQLSRARWVQAVAQWWGGQLPVPLNYYGADTSRWSGGEKLNLQNLPRNNNGEIITDPNSGRLRRSMRAPEGGVVVVRDLNNIEGRVLAWVAQQQHLLDLFRNGDCPYLYMAAGIYGLNFAEMTKKSHPGERNVGKVAVLGLGYGLGAQNFWVQLNTGPMGMDPIPCDFPFAHRIVTTYRTTNDKIVGYWGRCDQYLADMYRGASYEDGPLTIGPNHIMLPNGMALQYPNLQAREHANGFDFKFGPKGPNRKIYGGHLTENIVQALARVIINEQMITVDRNLRDNYGWDQARLVHMVHDEMIAIVPEDKGDEVYQMMGDVMSTPPTWATDLPLLSEGGVAQEYSK
ncbi:hypothetical protein DV711_06300 [Motiliproteus coralliicola]|uniref:DNA-directed DNA polymerase n=1 Tax=Motiliproteus coralliicola TaxID=2283196 RepID=A0A369WXA8_9GAMM|nr:DNA polymerase [Motiliproteus coralliicola]RDE25164.1 hypothetical protein DV711_06300 [Motiliproteus coralliicola]